MSSKISKEMLSWSWYVPDIILVETLINNSKKRIEEEINFVLWKAFC